MTPTPPQPFPGTLITQPTTTPTRKVMAGGAAGAFTVILVWAVQAFTEVKIPAEVASAITTLLAFGAAYFTRERQV